MKITLFSSNQPRHLSLANKLANFCDELYFVSEVKTLFPGKISDHFRRSDVMERYFSNVLRAEKLLFPEINFLRHNVKTLAIKNGDLSLLEEVNLYPALKSDIYIVFGSSFIKGWLADFLIDKAAINVHLGISPYYRGSSCNFWALYDKRPAYVGATLHKLSNGLDDGDIISHCLPCLRNDENIFSFTMRSVSAAHEGLLSLLQDKNLPNIKTVRQDKTKELRYSKRADFTDNVASEFLDVANKMQLQIDNYPELVRPQFFE